MSPLSIFEGARGSKFVCDAERGFGDAVATISRRADAPINSCAREQAAEPLLDRIGKMSQRQLWECSRNCEPSCRGNCNPANPPGFSTHERRNDGVAYSGIRRGGRLRVYQRGIDVQRDRVGAFIRAAASEGWLVTQTYPGSVQEAQHVNFRRKPRISLWEFRPLRRGMGRNPLDRRRLRRVVKYLKRIQAPGELTPYLNAQGKFARYGERVEDAIKRFQRDHHINSDGVCGLRTYTVLRGTARRPPSRLDAAGVKHLVEFEGELLFAYDDPAGHATFGVGHLLHRGPCTDADFRRYGSRTNRKPADEMRRRSREFLDEDARRFERAVMKHVPERWRKSRDRFNAFVSLAFNLGEGILTPEAPLQDVGRALVGRPDRAGVNRLATAILQFDKAGSPPRPMPGLTRRREAEVHLIRRNK
jgi:GH24 family phage-related lysozyme (muramidase)